MPPMQIVFLFDLDAYIDDNLKVVPDLSRQLVCLRLTCLKILSYYHTIEPNLKWGFKFFDSRGSLTQTMCKYSFPGVSLENFEILENEISLRYQRHVSYLDALIVSAQRDDPSTLDSNFQSESKTKTYPIQVLQHALTQILYEYHWNNQMALFSPAKTNHVFNNLNKNNILFLITKCPKNEDNFSRYFGTDYASITSTKFSKTLLSQSLHEQLLMKSSILWIWINTNTESFLGELTPGILSKIAEMLKSLKCALIPISVLSQPPHILKFEDNDNEILKMDLFNSLIPFSTIFSQSTTYPFYSDKSAISRYSTIYFQDNELFVSLTKIPLQWSRNLQFPRKNTHVLEEKVPSKTVHTNISLTWTKFVIHYAVAKKFHLQTYDTILCLPSVSSKDSNFKKFQSFSKSLILKNISLFMTCESSCGVKMPGLFSPISDTSALISILDINSLFKNKNDAHVENMKAIKSDNGIEEVLNNADKQNTASLFEDSSLSPFQIEILEHWYKPSASICEVTTLCKESQKSLPDLKAFYKKLAEKLKPSPEKENIAPNDDTNVDNSSEATEIYDVSDLSYDELITVLNTAYDSALKPGISILQTAKRIVKSGFSFFQQKSSGSKEDLLRSFLTEFFYVSNRKIIEKYNQSEENDKMIRECQLQVLLVLETELLVPSSEISNCINNVTSLLRSMSFYCGAAELNKFLHDVLKENYKESLYDILVEIGDELDIPLFEEEDDSFYEPSEPPSSVSVAASNNSQTSALSVKSSTSSIELSRAGSRKLIKRRSDIMDNSRKSRQILLTKSSPKKRKYKNLYPGAENIPTRFSPRLSSKRKRERNQKHISPGHVRRNLFPKDQKLSTPKYSQSASPRGKKRMRTPKPHHVLKTRFVAETPTAKQNRSALQRRKSFMDTDSSEISLTEIAESPKIVKNAKDSVHREILKRLTSLESRKLQITVEQSAPNSNLYTQYTPESKRRLSLKLFSKLLTSPTARMGLKKCSKRLFEQVSPQIDNRNHKKLKTDPEDEGDILESPDISSQQITPETPK